MSTAFKTILPIPESTVVGTGTYVIPANKYAFVSGMVRLATFAGNSSATNGNAGGAVGVGSAHASTVDTHNDDQHNATTWLVAGDTISYSVQLQVIDGQVNWGNTRNYQTISKTHFYRILINGSEFISAQHVYHRSSSIGGTSLAATYAQTRGDGFGAVVVSLYPIPKNNLPTELIEGN